MEKKKKLHLGPTGSIVVKALNSQWPIAVRVPNLKAQNSCPAHVHVCACPKSRDANEREGLVVWLSPWRITTFSLSLSSEHTCPMGKILSKKLKMLHLKLDVTYFDLSTYFS